MDSFEYYSILLKRSEENLVLTFTAGTDSVQEKVIEKVCSWDAITFFENGHPSRMGWHLKETPLFYIQPYMAELGKEGWEVVEYKSDQINCFGEVLFKRKV